MNQKLKNSLFFAALGLVFYVPFLGGVHLFDWDEINFAEMAREMILLEDYLRVYINFEPFWEKPPLFVWLQAISMKIFGINEFAARFPNAICGSSTLVILYRIGCFLKGNRFGVLWALSYFGSILPFLYFKSGIIDPWFNLLIFSGLYFLILFYWKKEEIKDIVLEKSKWFYFLMSGLTLGLAILMKGPVAFLIISLVLGVYWIFEKFRFYINPLEYIAFAVLCFSVSLAWLGIETFKNGSWFIQEFTTYQIRLLTTHDAGHKGFLGYHFVVLLVGVFPASIFAIRSFYKFPKLETWLENDFHRWMKILFWVVLILFSLVQSKIVHYSSLCYFPMTFLAASVIEKILDDELSFEKWMKGLFWFVGGVFVILFLALPVVGKNIDFIKPLFSKDPFAMANLEAQIEWYYMDCLPGLFLLGVMIFFFKTCNKALNAKAFKFLFGGTGIFVMLALIFIINNIEGYSQNAAIEFFKSKSQEDCYVMTFGYKSYAHLFYNKKRPPTNENHSKHSWLLGGEIDKTVYLAAKINRADELIKNPNLVELYRKNGFVFFQRKITEQQ